MSPRQQDAVWALGLLLGLLLCWWAAHLGWQHLGTQHR